MAGGFHKSCMKGTGTEAAIKRFAETSISQPRPARYAHQTQNSRERRMPQPLPKHEKAMIAYLRRMSPHGELVQPIRRYSQALGLERAVIKSVLESLARRKEIRLRTVRASDGTSRLGVTLMEVRHDESKEKDRG